jgi:hypothetical protein
MAPNFTTSRSSKLLAAAVAVAACAGGVAVPASATASENPVRTHTSSDKLWVGGAELAGKNGVQLGKGMVVKDEGIEKAQLYADDHDMPIALQAVWTDASLNARASAYLPIFEDGQKTDYSIKLSITVDHFNPGHAEADCVVYESIGGHDAPGHYSCETKRVWLNNDWKVTVAPIASK